MAGREEIAQARQTVAVIGGTGALGFGLALRWAIAGTPIVIGSRDAGRAADAAARIAEQARAAGAADPRIDGLLNEDAAARSSSVVLSVPFAAQAQTLKALRNAILPQSVLVDATVPLATAVGGRPTRSISVWQGSAAQQAVEMAPRGVAVVSAFHSVSAAALSDPSQELGEDVLMAGDDRKAKDDVAELIRRIPGLRPVDCGDLEIARILEQLTPVLISVNKRYKVKHSGIRVTGLEHAGG